MGRKPIDADRRQKIVDATLNCIHRYGYQDTTLAKICADAGLSTGNVHYYFGGKQNLLEAAMRSLLRSIRGEMIQNLDLVLDPFDRIEAILHSNFHPSIFRAETCLTWLHFWAQAPHDPALARLERINRTRFLNNLVHELRKLLPRDKAVAAARQTVAMVDGLWIEKAQVNNNLAPDVAEKLAVDFLKSGLCQTTLD